MSLDFQRLRPKRFPKKSFKHSQESRYWKKFENVLLEKEDAEATMIRSEVCFCPSNTQAADKSNMLATAVSARVDFYRVYANESEDADKMKPDQRIYKFKDLVTALKLRQDGNIIVTGEKAGKLQVIELSNKFILKTYEEHNQ